MLTLDDIKDIVSKVTYKDGWTIQVYEGHGRSYIQVSVDASVGICSVSKQNTAWKSGKHYLSPYMCKQEIVGVCFAAIKASEEHEMREWFRYKGASIFNPHLDPDQLVELAKKKSAFVTRPDRTSMTLEEPDESTETHRDSGRGIATNWIVNPRG